MFLEIVYKKLEQNASFKSSQLRTLGKYKNKNCANVTQKISKNDIDFKTEETKNTEDIKTKLGF